MPDLAPSLANLKISLKIFSLKICVDGDENDQRLAHLSDNTYILMNSRIMRWVLDVDEKNDSDCAPDFWLDRVLDLQGR